MIAENKRPGAALALVKEQPTTSRHISAGTPRGNAPTEQSGRTGNADEEPGCRGRRGVG